MSEIKWEDNILGFVPRKDWLEIPFQITRQGSPVDKLFGDRKTDNITAEWESLATEYMIPMMAQFHAFDVEANTTFRFPIDSHSIEKGLIKVKINQTERMQTLLRSGVQKNEDMYRYVMDDAMRLSEQVITRTKVAKNEVMATGKMTINENNLDLTVDYGVPEANLALTLDFGLGADEDIPSQLLEIVDFAKYKGATINGMMTSKKTINLLRKNEAIQKSIGGVYQTGRLLSMTEIQGYLSDEFGINDVILNDDQYAYAVDYDASGRPVQSTARYYPKDKVSFYSTNPGGQLGIGLWGDPPETNTYVQRYLGGTTSGYDPYVWITQWAEEDPAVLWTKASTLFIPVLFNPNSLYVATVTETPADGA